MTSDLTAVVAFIYVFVFFVVSSQTPHKREATGDEIEGDDLKNELLSGSGFPADQLSKYKSSKISMSNNLQDELYSTLNSSQTSGKGSPSLSENSRLKGRKSSVEMQAKYSSTVSSSYSVNSKKY